LPLYPETVIITKKMMTRFVVFLNLCAMASAQVPEHVLEMFENETLAVNETNDTLVLILTPPDPTKPPSKYTKSPTTLSPTLGKGETYSPTTLAPTPAPAPKASVELELSMDSASDFNLDAFLGELATTGMNITEDTEVIVKYVVSMDLEIEADDLTESDMIALIAQVMGVDASIVSAVISGRRLTGRRLAPKTVTGTAESEDAAAIDDAKSTAASFDAASVLSILKSIDTTKYASAAVASVGAPTVAAKVAITQPTTEDAGADLAESMAASIQSKMADLVAASGSTGLAKAIETGFTVETQFPTAAPTKVPTPPPTPAPPTPAPPTPAPPTPSPPTTEAPTTAAPTDSEEESGASLERAGLLTVAIVAFTAVVRTQ